jgi:EAL domain-containing protein (putative c-di-GMP-specific phosphodiesterase class I)
LGWVTAEGVDTDEQLSSLKPLSCYVLQVYLFGRPAKTEQLEKDFNTVNIKNLLERFVFSKSDQAVRGND